MRAGKPDAPKPLKLAADPPAPPPGFPAGWGCYPFGVPPTMPMPYGYGFGGLPIAAPQAAPAPAPAPQPQTIIMGGAAGGGGAGGGGSTNGCGRGGGQDLLSSLGTLNGLRNLLQPQRAHRSRGLLVHAKRPGYYRVPAYPYRSGPTRGVRRIPTPAASVQGSTTSSHSVVEPSISSHSKYVPDCEIGMSCRASYVLVDTVLPTMHHYFYPTHE